MKEVFIIQGRDASGNFVTHVRFDQSSADEIASMLANASVKRFEGDFRTPKTAACRGTGEALPSLASARSHRGCLPPHA